MSPHYVAPEVLEGRVSQRTDQYSLAVTYFQLRAGRLPFAGDSIHQIVYAHLRRPPDLSGLPEDERPSSPGPWRNARGPLAVVPGVRAGICRRPPSSTLARLALMTEADGDGVHRFTTPH